MNRVRTRTDALLTATPPAPPGCSDGVGVAFEADADVDVLEPEDLLTDGPDARTTR